MTEASISAAVLGKVPWHPEFLRCSQLSAEIWAFDEWLFRNAQSQMTEWPGKASYGFLLQLAPAGMSPMAGVIGPSHDAAGRPYPLAIAGRVAGARDIAAHPEILPIFFEDYWHAALEILREARVGPADGDEWRLDRLSQKEKLSLDAAFDLYANWVEQLTTPQLSSLMGRPPNWLAGAASRIAQMVGPHTGERVRSIRVPLGHAAGGALCFWLDVIRRATRWQAHVPSFFWSHDEQGGDALVFIGAPGDRALATLWDDAARGDDVFDLTALDEASSSVGTSEQGDAESSLWSLLERVDGLVKVQSL
jgi:type VI secretion system ImpM family protein